MALLYLSGCGALSVRLTYINVVMVEQRSWLRYRGFATIKVAQQGTMPLPPYSGGSLPLHLENALARYMQPISFATSVSSKAIGDGR